jgi:hypothetical protein
MKRKPLSLNDLRLGLSMGNSYLNQMRLVTDRVMVGELVDDEDEQAEDGDDGGNKMNGVVMTNGTHDEDVHMEDVEGHGWPGATVKDREELGAVLEDLLAVRQ